MYKEGKHMSAVVLVVDDLLENRLMLEEILKEKCTVVMAEDGFDAMRRLLLMPEKPALVLSDVMMPKMDGFGLLEFIKNDPKLRDIPVIFLTSVSDEVRALNAGAIDFISKPLVPEVVKMRVVNQIELSLYRYKLENMVQAKVHELESTKETFLETLATMIEFRSLESSMHIKRTKKLTEVLIDYLINTPQYGPRLKALDTRMIVKAAALHDIGKVAIPDLVLHKPAKLTPEEFETIKTHTVIGSEMILSMKSDESDEYINHCYDIIRHHHERWDGRGYPDRLAGEDIPLSARIVALVDVYDALISERVYKKAKTHESS
jgi:putative two-component system response regulator